MAKAQDLVEANQQQASSRDAEQLKQAEADQPRTPAKTEPASPEAAGAEPSGYRGDNPSTAGPGQTEVNSATPESRLGHLNPSAPENANITPGSTVEK